MIPSSRNHDILSRVPGFVALSPCLPFICVISTNAGRRCGHEESGLKGFSPQKNEQVCGARSLF